MIFDVPESRSDDDSEDDLLLHDTIADEDPENAIDDIGAIEGPYLPKFLFKIKEENKLTQKCLQKIAIATKQLFQGSIQRIKRKAEDCLAEAGIHSGDIPGFQDSFQDEMDEYKDIMTSKVETFHKRDDCNIPFVVSITMICCGINYVTNFHNAKIMSRRPCYLFCA